jgi:signal transduction histidine kinase
METEAGLVLDEGFDWRVARVVGSFVCEGFTVRALDRGTLRRPAFHGGLLRYALLDAMLPDVPVDNRRPDPTLSTHSGCLLREQEALAQLGQLAAVVAHEVRNPLAGLRGSLQILESRLPRDMREREIIGPMIQRIDGLSRIVQDMLLFARPPPASRRHVELRRIVSDAVSSAGGRPGVSVGGDDDRCRRCRPCGW